MVLFLPGVKSVDRKAATAYKKHMSKCAYISEISAWWTIERQKAALADVLADATVYCDLLNNRDRRILVTGHLLDRANLLRPTKVRSGTETIHVASLICIAKSEQDMRDVSEAVTARGAILVSSEGIEGDVVEAWRRAKRKSRIESATTRGAAVSAANRRARAVAAVERLKDRWKLPSKDYPSEPLLKEVGVSRNTVKAILGCNREQYQARHQATLKRRLRKDVKKEEQVA